MQCQHLDSHLISHTVALANNPYQTVPCYMPRGGQIEDPILYDRHRLSSALLLLHRLPPQETFLPVASMHVTLAYSQADSEHTEMVVKGLYQGLTGVFFGELTQTCLSYSHRLFTVTYARSAAVFLKMLNSTMSLQHRCQALALELPPRLSMRSMELSSLA